MHGLRPMRAIRQARCCKAVESSCCWRVSMRRLAGSATMAFILFASIPARAQAPSGPLPPKPGVTVQQPPRATHPKIKVQVALVNTPVTAPETRGEMVKSLEAQDFQITDNVEAQKVSDFDS